METDGLTVDEAAKRISVSDDQQPVASTPDKPPVLKPFEWNEGKSEQDAALEIEALMSEDSETDTSSEPVAEDTSSTETESEHPLRQHLKTAVQDLVQAVEQYNRDAAALNNSNLQAINPGEYSARLVDLQQRREQIQSRRGELENIGQRVKEDEAAEHQENLVRYLEAERKELLSALPSWKNEKVKAKEQKEMREFMLSKGYTNDAINGISNHRDVLLIRTAMQAERANKKSTEALKDKLRRNSPQAKAKTTLEYERKKHNIRPGTESDAALRLRRMGFV